MLPVPSSSLQDTFFNGLGCSRKHRSLLVHSKGLLDLVSFSQLAINWLPRLLGAGGITVRKGIGGPPSTICGVWCIDVARASGAFCVPMLLH